MGKSRSPSLTKDPILPEPSSRFLKYLGLDAYPKPRLKKLSGIPPNSGRISGPWSQSSSSIPSNNGLVSVKPLLPGSVEIYDQQPRQNQHRTAKPTLSLRPVQGSRDFDGSTGSISVPFSGYGPRTHSASSSSLASPTTSHAPSRGRKFSLPFIPPCSSPSSSSKASIETPPLSPTTNSYKTSPSTFPPTPNTQRPLLRPRAPVVEFIEPLQYAASRQPQKPPSHIPPSSRPLIHPRFDFEARRSARSRSPGNQITLAHPFAVSRNEPASHPPVTSTRLSTFLELTQYLSEDSASSVENDDESIVEFADVLAGGRQPKTGLGLPSIERFASENALTHRTRRNQALLDNLSACTFPFPVSASPQQLNDKIIHEPPAPFPHNVPLEPHRIIKSIPSKSPNPVYSSSQVGVGHPTKHPGQASSAFPWPASDSLKAARAAIDFIATLPADSVAAESVQFSSPMLPRSTKPSKRRSRNIFHLPSRAGTPIAAGSRGGTASGLSGNTDSSFLNVAGSISQWPIPPSAPPSGSNVCIPEATLKSRNIPSLAASGTEHNHHPHQYITEASSLQHQNNTSTIFPSLRYSLFVLDTNETNANS